MMFGLNQITIDKLNAVFSQFSEIEAVIIFGSGAKGNYKEGSDIDITLLGKELTERNVSALSAAIDELNTPYFYDISIFERLSSESLREHIERVGKVFYRRSI